MKLEDRIDTLSSDIGNGYRCEIAKGEHAYLRKAEWKDLDTLFAWANDREVRKNSFFTEPITYEEHKVWFGKVWKEEGVQIYIFCERGLEKGMLRLEFGSDEVVIHYSIAKGYRNMGKGQRLILLAEQEICNQFQNREKSGIVLINAYVKKENIASNHIFQKMGYKKQGEKFMKKLVIKSDSEKNMDAKI